MIYKGSCHCGQVALEVEGDIGQVIDCNCSMCSRRGSLLWFVPHDKLKLLSDEAKARTYTFNKQLIKHRFCPECGIHAFGEGSDRSGQKMAAINVRCLEGVDLSALSVKHFDGRAL